MPFVTFHEAEVDGVPVLWTEAPGPLAGGLVFGVGRAHETLATSGITHLVEHLALSVVQGSHFAYNGMVDQTSTSFVASGSPDEVRGFFGAVTKALAALPLDRLETEQQILLTEEAARGASPFDTLIRIRFGARAHGLAGLSELGLRRITPDEVEAWATERFVARAARAWFTGPPPEGLSFSALRQGVPHPPAEVTVTPRGTGPAFLQRMPRGCAFSLLGKRSVPLHAAMATLGDRAQRELRHERGLIYELAHWHDILTADDVNVMLGIDSLPERVEEAALAFVDLLDALAENGPTESELQTYRQLMTTGFEDVNNSAIHLVADTKDLLLGRPSRPFEGVIDEAASLDPATVARAVREATGSLLADLPQEADLSHRLDPVPSLPIEDLPNGRVFKPQALAQRRDVEVVLYDEGVLMREKEKRLYMRFDECAALIEGSEGTIGLVDVHSRSIELDPANMVRGLQLRRAVYEKVPRALIIPLEPGARRRGAVEEIAARDLYRRWIVEKELTALPDELEEGEIVQVLAEASRGATTTGLLVVTDRRVMFVRSARGLQVEEVRRHAMGRIEVERDRLTVHSTEGRKLAVKDVVPPERARDAAQHLGLSVPKSEPSLMEWRDARPVLVALLAVAFTFGDGGMFGSVVLGAAAILEVWTLGHLSRGLSSPRAWVHLGAMVAGTVAIVITFVG